MSREIQKEISNLVLAWKQYLKHEILLRDDVHKFVNSLGIGISLSVFIGFILWVRGSVYAQGEIALEPVSHAPAFAAFSWIMSGGFISALVGFARARYNQFKRIFDFLVSGLALIAASPLFVLISVLIKFDSDGPVFFRQQRIGKQGKLFYILKFRSMRQNAELDTGAVWAQENDPRVTKLGRFLRTSHIDEIPQLINVFKGEMSLVGPRPERPELQTKIKEDIPDFDYRLAIKPGITGLAQSRYQYGATIKDCRIKLKYDKMYIRKMCWALDFMIVWWTMGRVITGNGAR